MEQHGAVIDTSTRTVSLNAPDSTRRIVLSLPEHPVPSGSVCTLEVESLEAIPVVRDIQMFSLKISPAYRQTMPWNFLLSSFQVLPPSFVDLIKCLPMIY